MLTCLVRRLLAVLWMLLLVSLLVFLMLRLTPGDTAMALAGETASPEQIDRVNQAMGLDRPLPTQYLLWLAHLALGDLGHSTQFDASVTSLVAQRLGPSVALVVPAGALALLAALPLGMLAARRHGGWLDRTLAALSPAARALPGLVLAYVLIWLFALKLGWLPLPGEAQPGAGLGAGLRRLLLPVLALALPAVAPLVAVTRQALLQALHAPHIHTARAFGLPERTLLLRHALGSAALPIAAAVGRGSGWLLGGLVVVESLFALPGLGQLAVEAVRARDFAAVQGVVFFFALAHLLMRLLIELACDIVDPRRRG